MKAVIVYDSFYGHTRKIAESIRDGLGKDHEIVMFRAEVKASPDLENVDLLIVGSPTQGGWYTEPIKSFFGQLDESSLKDICGVAFDTSTYSDNHGFVFGTLTRLMGNAAPRIAKELNRKGARCIDSEIFYVEGKKGPLLNGEEERARHWAGQLMKKHSKTKA
jgi:flavodoxin